MPISVPGTGSKAESMEWTVFRAHRFLIRCWQRAAIRSFLFALVATSVVWGQGLSPLRTFTPEAQVTTIHPNCRVSDSRLICDVSSAKDRIVDAGSPGWTSIPTSYFLRHARERGEPRPKWNPYDGSGYPLALDGHSSRLSLSEWLTSHVAGDQGQDIVIFLRFLSWTFALVWAIALFEKNSLLLTVMAFVATLAPYGADYVQTAFLDADLISPWFLLLLVHLVLGRVRLRMALLGALALGLLAGTFAFPQAQVVLVIAMVLLALLAAPAIGSGALWLGGAFALGTFLVFPWWLPMLANLDQFITSRTAQCVCEQSLGWKSVLANLTTYPAKQSTPDTVTLAGLILLPWVPRRFWFVGAAIVVLTLWLALGLPHMACSLPVVSGMRFARHLLPHLQMLFIFAIALAINRLGHRLESGRWSLLILLPVLTAALVLAGSAPTSAPGRMLFVAGLVAVVLALVALSLPRSRPGLRRFGFALTLMALVFPSYLLGSEIAFRLVEGTATTAQLPPCPAVLDTSTPLGKVQELSQTEDRRHFSPHYWIYPNWSQALQILDLRSVNALYPSGVHQLNAALFKKWERDPAHGLNPDRFTAPKLSGQYLGTDFQRVLALHRVSLLTFSVGHAKLPGNPGPYQASRCQSLGADPDQGTESFICPEVGTVGFFPEVVRVVGTRMDALNALKRMSPTDLVRTALLGPELDPGLGPNGPSVAKGQVLSMARSANHLLYWLYVEKPGTFVVADAYFRGWTATVNGQPTAISRANVAFKAVQVPQGYVDLHFHFDVAGF